MNRPALLPSLGRWALVVALCLPLLGAAIVVAPVNLGASHALLHAWCIAARRVFNVHVQVLDHNGGRYDRSPYLFILLNQTSLTESLVIPTALPLPVAFLVNLEYAALPFLGWLARAQGSVIVVRQWPAQAKRAIDRAVQSLRRYRSFCMSIEGRRSVDGRISPYKKGAAVLAIRAGARIVPFGFRGAHEVLPYGEWRVRPGTVTVELFPVIEVDGLCYEDRDALVEHLRALADEYRLGGGQQAAERSTPAVV